MLQFMRMLCVVHEDGMGHAFGGGKKLRKTDETYTTILYDQYRSIFQF